MTTEPPPDAPRRAAPVSQWAARQAEFDAASKADADAARRAREAAAEARERDYDNEGTTRAGMVVVVALALLGLFVTFRLIRESQLEDCLLGHRYNCADLIDR
jgi:hypothetical protein